MSFRDHDNCDKCKECLKDPGKTYCNTTCEDPSKNCYESYKVFTPYMYGKVFVNLQPYENLFNIDDAFAAGTVFKDLYSPYCDVKYIKEVEKRG